MSDAQTQTSRSPRSAVVAAVLTAICPGLGHFYAGDLPGAAVMAVLNSIAISVLMIGGVLVPNALAVIAWVCLYLAIAIWIAQILLAIRAARRRRDYVLQGFNRVWIYVVFFVGTWIVGQFLGGSFRRQFVEPFRVPSHSMWPTLRAGDQFFTVKRGPAASTDTGAVVVVTVPGPPLRSLVERVIAHGGDLVEVQRGIVRINGIEIPETPVPCPTQAAGATGDDLDAEAVCAEERLPSGRTWIVRHIPSREYDFPPTRVPSGHVFLMGDNRENSSDSRYVGAFPEDQIVGRAVVVWLSLSPTLQWQPGRIGTQL